MDDDIREVTTERLEAEAVTLAGRMAAELCRFLLVLAELDRREAWKSWGCRSVVQWLSWRCGVSSRTAREHVRVAHGLRRLPRTTEAFARGELSYSKVRAITRLPAVDDEAELVELAREATAAQLDRVVGATLVAAADPGEVAALRRLVTRERDGLGELHARLLPEQLAVVDAAVAAAVERMPVDSGPAGPRPIAERRADALVVVCEAYLAEHRPKTRPGCQRQQVVLHVDADVVAGRRPATVEGSGIALHPATARRLACDATVLALFEDGRRTLGGGRTVRLIGRRLRRALERRSGGACEWPGCDQRTYLDGHHIRHWEDGGPTEVANLALLCWWHHHAAHEGGCRVRLDGTAVRAFAPDGAEVVAAPPVRCGGGPAPHLDAEPAGLVAGSAGERLDLGDAVTALLGRLRPPEAA